MALVRSAAFAMYAISASAAVQAVQAAAASHRFSIPNTYPSIAACANEPLVFSCENTTAIRNTCCSPSPGGLVLQTQFWDTYTGLEDDAMTASCSRNTAGRFTASGQTIVMGRC
jgi:hypothetical protein